MAAPARGDILYRGASDWLRLPAGTSGNFLKTNGAGADPSWAAGNSGTVTTSGSPASGDIAKFSSSTAITTATAGTDYTALAFKTISVSGQSDVVADSAADTLTLAAGAGMTL